jgi:hypothetical protein
MYGAEDCEHTGGAVTLLALIVVLYALVFVVSSIALTLTLKHSTNLVSTAVVTWFGSLCYLLADV